MTLTNWHWTLVAWVMIEVIMDRYWFFTWRTYGTWLPGEDGFVGYYRNLQNYRVVDNSFGQPNTGEIKPLKNYAERVMKSEPVMLTVSQADLLIEQFQETSACRKWQLDIIGVMANHIHIVFGVMDDPDPSEMLKTWKSYASRKLNHHQESKHPTRWFADGGSKRPVKTDTNRVNAIQYVRDQEFPLRIWSRETLVTRDGDTGRIGDVSRQSQGKD
jgi:REP element-mobilizing transposase RayT